MCGLISCWLYIWRCWRHFFKVGLDIYGNHYRKVSSEILANNWGVQMTRDFCIHRAINYPVIVCNTFKDECLKWSQTLKKGNVQDNEMFIFFVYMNISLLTHRGWVTQKWIIISPVSEGSGDVMVLRRSRPPPATRRPPPAMVLTR